MDHMSQNGLGCMEIRTDGKIHRYSSEGKNIKLDEWYIAHEGLSDRGNQYMICTYGSWSTGDKYTFKSWTDNEFHPEERKMLQERLERERRESENRLKEQYHSKAQDAQSIWDKSYQIPPNQSYNEYCVKKRICPIGARFGNTPKGLPALIIDINDITGKIRSLQYIYIEEGKTQKRFLTGGEIKGNFHTIGKIANGKKIIVTEGYATGVSIYKATLNAVVVALSCNWLTAVIVQLKEKYPQSEIIIAADRDPVGVKKSREAGSETSSFVVFPDFPLIFKNKEFSDFNDLAHIAGEEAVRDQLTDGLLIFKKLFIRK